MTSTKVGQLGGSTQGKEPVDRVQRFPVVFYIAVLIKRLREARASHHPRNANMNCAPCSIEHARAPIFDAAICSAMRAPSLGSVVGVDLLRCDSLLESESQTLQFPQRKTEVRRLHVTRWSLYCPELDSLDAPIIGVGLQAKSPA
jgi:hypothetical protein